MIKKREKQKIRDRSGLDVVDRSSCTNANTSYQRVHVQLCVCVHMCVSVFVFTFCCGPSVLDSFGLLTFCGCFLFSLFFLFLKSTKPIKRAQSHVVILLQLPGTKKKEMLFKKYIKAYLPYRHTDEVHRFIFGVN